MAEGVGAGGLKTYTLGGDGAPATLTVFEHGGHVASWRTASASEPSAYDENLFVSGAAVYKPPKAIRGGVPVCFPQFSDLGPVAQQHGFARNRPWSLVDASASHLTLALSDDDETRALWPHAFRLEIRYELLPDRSMAMTTTVNNTGSESFTFTYALHTYFRVPDVTAATVVGLKGTTYMDSLQGRVKVAEEEESVVFDKEVDRIYLDVPKELSIASGSGAGFVVATENLPDAVVWNPWIEKAKAMGDFGDEEYTQMVCVESAAAASPVAVAPGTSWSATVQLTRTG